jgi:hypothetical protein
MDETDLGAWELVHAISFGVVHAYLVRGADGDLLVDTGLPGMGAWSLLGTVRL